jgi:hypothetical protein
LKKPERKKNNEDILRRDQESGIRDQEYEIIDFQAIYNPLFHIDNSNIIKIISYGNSA